MRHLYPLALIACGAEAPATPSFQQDVMPILAANCIRCHGFPPIGGAPPEFRLDSFENVIVSDGTPGTGICGGDPDDPGAQRTICGAATFAAAIPPRLRDDDRPMPPRFPLDDYEIETLENWARDPSRGAIRPGNAVPEVAILAVAQEGALVRVQVRVDDRDGDLVSGALQATVDRERIVGAVRSGTLDLTWDVTGIAAGDYPLTAVVDDGAELHTLGLGTVTVTEVP